MPLISPKAKEPKPKKIIPPSELIESAKKSPRLTEIEYSQRVTKYDGRTKIKEIILLGIKEKPRLVLRLIEIICNMEVSDQPIPRANDKTLIVKFP